MSLASELGLEKPFEDLRHETMLNVVHTANLLAAVGTVFFRQFDLTEAQFNVLFALKYKMGNLTQSGLGKRLVVTRASITSILDKLEEKELVVRENVPDNRRIYHVALTPEGQRLVDHVEPFYRQEIYRTFEGLTDKECKHLIQILERVRARAVVRKASEFANKHRLALGANQLDTEL